MEIAKSTISIDYACVNCDKVFIVEEKPKLYCSQKCQQDAKLVRYVRACIKDGRINDPEVRNAIFTKFAFAYGEKGYYDEKARKLSDVIRKSVIERDKNICRQCGAEGTEIDHIYDDRNEMDNLQLLCGNCHNKKTKSKMIEITPKHERHEEVQTRKIELRTRIDSIDSLRPCDDEKSWNQVQKRLIKEQHLLFKQIKQDLSGITENRDPFIEELVTQELDELNDLWLQRDDLRIQEKNQIDQILKPEILEQVKAIREEFSGRTKSVNESIAATEKRIKDRVKQYGLKIKASELQAVFRKGSVFWDTKALEEYAKTHPEILQFRKEGKESVSIIHNKKNSKLENESED